MLVRKTCKLSHVQISILYGLEGKEVQQSYYLGFHYY